MTIKAKIKVLIVDDSLFFRETLAQGLAADPLIEVVGTAADAFVAKDKIKELRPDVLTLDVEMPKMSGIEFLQRLMPQYPMPVVVVSSISESVFEALKAGAVDFVNKSDIYSEHNPEAQFNEIIVKIKIASTAKVGFWKHETSPVPRLLPQPEFGSGDGKENQRVIAIGASTGGTEAIAGILKQFPPNMPPTLIVQHMPPVFSRMYAERLNNSCLMAVKEAENGDEIIPGRVLVAPGDYQMRVKKTRDNHYVVECQKGERVNGHCPSVGVLFDSVAKYYGKYAVGVILTGMGSDGAEGLLRMRQSGARTIGQDEESCVVYGMPKVAREIGAVEKQASLVEIPGIIREFLNGKS